MRRNTFMVLLLVFGASGASALIYQLVWARKLELIFGTSVQSITAILFVFFGGLALGSYLFGKIVDSKRTNLLRLYAWVELGIGIYALLTILIFPLISNLQIILSPDIGGSVIWLTIVRYILLVGALIIPTTLIGATLPIMTKYVTKERDSFSTKFGWLYSVHTLGGIIGVLLTAFFLIAYLGILGALIFAICISMLVSVIAFALSSKADATVTDKPIKNIRIEEGINRNIVILSFFAAGFGAIALEILWTRTLIMIIGNSVYSFGIVLAVFLTGITLGSIISTRNVSNIRKPIVRLAKLEFSIGFLVFVSVLLFYYLPSIYLGLLKLSAGSFGSLNFSKYLLASMAMFLPTFLMGMAFPVAARIFLKRPEAVGNATGSVYSVNTIGGIFAPIIATYVLIPVLGLQYALISIGFLFMLTGILIMYFHKHKFKRGASLGYGTILLVAIIVISVSNSWSLLAIDSGVFVYAKYREVQEDLSISGITSEREIIFFKDGPSSTVSVSRNSEGFLGLRINGKIDASTGGDMTTQVLLGSLPYLLHEDPKDALVIGLGSGITLGSLLQYSVESVDTVEIEPAVAEAARFFDETNHNALDDPRVNLYIDDARHFLRVNKKKYDVISAEPSNVWISGVSNLFTKEHFQLYADHLNENGIVVQWAHTNRMDNDDILTVLATFNEVFEHVHVWHDGDFGDLFLIGSDDPIEIDFNVLKERLSNNAVNADLKKIFLNDPLKILSLFILDAQTVKELTSDAKLHTDNRPILEFSTPRVFIDVTNRRSGLELLTTKLRSASEVTRNMTEEDVLDLKRYEEGLRLYANAVLFTGERHVDELIGLIRRSIEINPESKERYPALAELLRIKGEILAESGSAEEAKSLFEEASKLESVNEADQR